MAQMHTNGAGAAPALPATGEDFFELAMAYAAGRGKPADLVEAHKWFNVACARGYRPAAQHRAELAREMSAEEVAAAQREARLWLNRH